MSDDHQTPPTKRLRLSDNSSDTMENEVEGRTSLSCEHEGGFNASQDLFPDSSPSYAAHADAPFVAIQIEDDKDSTWDAEEDMLEAEEDIIRAEQDMLAAEQDIPEPEEDMPDPEEDMPDPEEDMPDPEEDMIDAEEEMAEAEQDLTEGIWLGVSLEELRRGCITTELPPVAHADNHTVMYQLPVVEGEYPQPFPPNDTDAWDGNHVRMPCSAHSLYLVNREDGETALASRWQLIADVLTKPISNCRQLHSAILEYNNKYAQQWHFNALHYLFEHEMEEDEASHFFSLTLPAIVRLALDLPHLLTRPLPLLRQHTARSLSLSQQQIASLLANAFLCTFPRRSSTKQRAEYCNFPDINFNRLFNSCRDNDGRPLERDVEKLKCVFNYLRRVCDGNAPKGVVTFTRRYLPRSSMPRWDRCDRAMPPLHVSSRGTIEQDGTAMLQVDFANCMVGGGVLGSGCVQEEIRFVVCPELIVSRLFTERLDATEALLVTGCEQFNSYSGYADSFKWEGDYRDRTLRDSSMRRECCLVAIDALYLRTRASQFSAKCMLRELNKAYVGFRNPEAAAGVRLPPVATGNWGCGAFRGDTHLKALLQLGAAAEARRSVAYFTFGDAALARDVARMHEFLLENRVTVATLWSHLSRYHERCHHDNGHFSQNLYAYLYDAVRRGNNDSERPVQRARQSTLRNWLNAAGTSSSHLSPQRPSAAQHSESVPSDNINTNNLQLHPQDIQALLEVPPPFDEAELEEKLSRIESGTTRAPATTATSASSSVPKRTSFFQELDMLDRKASGRSVPDEHKASKKAVPDERKSSGMSGLVEGERHHSPSKFLRAFERREMERRPSGSNGNNIVIEESPDSSRDGSQETDDRNHVGTEEGTLTRETIQELPRSPVREMELKKRGETR